MSRYLHEATAHHVESCHRGSDLTPQQCSDIAADKSDQQPLESRLRNFLKRKTAVRRILIESNSMEVC